MICSVYQHPHDAIKDCYAYKFIGMVHIRFWMFYP